MSALPWRTSWRIARRDLHAGFRGLRLLFLCLFLGVMTLAGIGSLTSAITGEIGARGQQILGGDIEVAMTQREIDPAGRAALDRLGQVSDTVRLRAMAVHEGAAPVLTELKAVDSAYPLYGTLTLEQGRYSLPKPDEILVSRALADRLGLFVGERLSYGDAAFTVRAIIADEPDRVGEGFTLGPVAIVSLDGMARAGLIQPGSLYTAKYRIRTAEGTDARALRESLEKRYEAQGWTFKDRDRAAPGTNRFIENMGQFLSLIGLSALVIAGIGVSNGVASYLGQKRASLATLKILGAGAADIERIYLIQIGAVALAAILSGLVVGAMLPLALTSLMGDLLPVQPAFRLHGAALATSAAYGLLIAFIFTLPPLARARTEPAAAILRAHVDPHRRWDRRTVLLVGIAGAALIAIVLMTARTPLFSAAVLAAVGAVLLILWLLGAGVAHLAARLPRPRRPLLRLALANLHRPGAQTATLMVALGLALTLFVTLAGIQTSLDAQIARTVPQRAPNLFVLDIPSTGQARFQQIVDAEAPKAQLNIVPSLRGTVVAYGDTRVADLAERPEGAWILRGERGITYSATLPEGSDLAEGQWWPADYQGPPLLSLDADQAGALGVGVGDSMTVSILGREITARVASLRTVNWDTMGFNYVLVFSPNTLASAPHSLTATITMDKAREGRVSAALLAAFPGVSVIAVSEVVGQVSALLDQMAGAILAAASVTILAGIAVLVGAIAAAREARAMDSVILKTLGATRAQLLGGQALEYALLATIVSAIALLLGSAASWFVMVQLFDFGWTPDWAIVLGTLLGGAALMLGVGIAGSLPLLSVRPARALRAI